MSKDTSMTKRHNCGRILENGRCWYCHTGASGSAGTGGDGFGSDMNIGLPHPTKPMTLDKLLRLAKKADKRLQQYQNEPPSSGSQKWIDVITVFEDLLDCIDELNPPIKETKDAD